VRRIAVFWPHPLVPSSGDPSQVVKEGMRVRVPDLEAQLDRLQQGAR
jgi:hypothetical protein